MGDATVFCQREEMCGGILHWTSTSSGGNSFGNRNSFNRICLTVVFTITELGILFATYRQNGCSSFPSFKTFIC